MCQFNVEGFGFDRDQDGYIRFAVQGGDAPHGSDPGINEQVTAATARSRPTITRLPTGHYKATLYDDSSPVQEKAKSKVFKVTCGGSPEDGGGAGGSADRARLTTTVQDQRPLGAIRGALPCPVARR